MRAGEVLPTCSPFLLRFMVDNTEYWVNDAGDAFTFKFPATVNFDGQLDRTGPYFPQTGLDLGALKKMHIQLKMHPLNGNDWDMFPEEAKMQGTPMSASKWKGIPKISPSCDTVLAPPLYPRDNPFWHKFCHQRKDQFSEVVTTDLLVGPVSSRHDTVPCLRRSDVGKGDTMQSPSKVSGGGGGSPGSSSAGSQNSTMAPTDQQLSDLPDPLGWYVALIMQFDLQDAEVVAPNICDGNRVVYIECQLKLQLSPITGIMHDKTTRMARGGSEFRNYMSDIKCKRKATDQPEGFSCSKKIVVYSSNDDGDNKGLSESMINETDAMQVTED
ncbi:hypothetical protein BDR07DRAFT_1477583 [Suillus spraguei]|nr:hypothetical protein BDR07DRAFT_1477583 [Suillus spraguei]